MTMTEGVIRPDAVSTRDGRLVLAVHLPWYRSLPLSCLESIEVALAGVPVPVESVVAEADATWDIRDPLTVTLDAAATPGDVVALEVGVAVRIPYIQQAPGVPLVQRALIRTEATVR
jgi:hypothetical protein